MWTWVTRPRIRQRWPLPLQQRQQRGTGKSKYRRLNAATLGGKTHFTTNPLFGDQ